MNIDAENMLILFMYLDRKKILNLVSAIGEDKDQELSDLVAFFKNTLSAGKQIK